MKSNREKKMLTRDKGASLTERSIPQALTDASATFVDSVNLSSVSERVRCGRRVVLKRRNAYSEQLADLANLYFRMSSIPIRFWSKVEDWRRWESECFQMLNGDRFRVFASGMKAVCVDKLPGKTLWEHLNRGTLTPQMLQAAGRELRRAHQLWSDEFGGGWSHGDATMSNVLYDGKTARARMIAFATLHRTPVPAKARPADYLVVFLLDVVAIAPSRRWLPFSLSF